MLVVVALLSVEVKSAVFRYLSNEERRRLLPFLAPYLRAYLPPSLLTPELHAPEYEVLARSDRH